MDAFAQWYLEAQAWAVVILLPVLAVFLVIDMVKRRRNR